MQDVVFAALFVVDHELNADVGAARPFRVWWVRAIAAHVSYVTHDPSKAVDYCHLSRIAKGAADIPSKNFESLFVAVFSTAPYAMALNGAKSKMMAHVASRESE
ncbi:hypothetical protein GCM10023067_27130 [Aminobacter aganoensis]